MSKPSEFVNYILKKGQARGAPSGGMLGGLFGGGGKEDESGAATTEQGAGKFKALITIGNKGESADKLRRKNWKMGQIIKLVNEIHVKRFGKGSII